MLGFAFSTFHGVTSSFRAGTTAIPGGFGTFYTGVASSFNDWVEPGIVTRSVSEGAAAIGCIPCLRFGLRS